MDDLNSHTRKTGNVFMCELLVHVVRFYLSIMFFSNINICSDIITFTVISSIIFSTSSHWM